MWWGESNTLNRMGLFTPGHFRALVLALEGIFTLAGFAGGAEPDDAIRPTGTEASLAALHVREGFRVELVAAEPLVMDPVAIDWDADLSLIHI